MGQTTPPAFVVKDRATPSAPSCVRSLAGRPVSHTAAVLELLAGSPTSCTRAARLWHEMPSRPDMPALRPAWRPKSRSGYPCIICRCSHRQIMHSPGRAHELVRFAKPARHRQARATHVPAACLTALGMDQSLLLHPAPAPGLRRASAQLSLARVPSDLDSAEKVFGSGVIAAVMPKSQLTTV